MKICSTSLINRETQINTLVRDNLKPRRLAIVGKIEKLVEKARELVGNMKELLGKLR